MITPLNKRLIWLLSIFFVLAILPGLSRLDIVVALLVFMPFALRPWVLGSYRYRTGVMVLVLACWLIWVQFGSSEPWLSGNTFISGLYVAFALKWMEARSLSEIRLLLTASLFLFALSCLYFSGFGALGYLVLGLLGYLCLNLLISRTGTSELLPALGSSGRLFLTALPMAVLLFITVPRMQGPLWDLGVVMGLPIELVVDPEQREQGFKGVLQANKVSRLKKSDAPVLVAEFVGAVPYKSRLYWRGPVYDLYDGTNWRMAKGQNSRRELLKNAFRTRRQMDDALHEKTDRVSYEARVSGHGQRWLYGLDFPYGSSPETFISNEFQVLGIRKLTQEFNYQQQAFLEYRGGRPLSADEKERYLHLPSDSNPGIVQWGERLKKQHGNPEDRLQALRIHLAQGGYEITPAPDLAIHKNSLDQFFLEDKAGGIEHLSSASVLILRAAGLPARLVSGYRGGSLIALTNFVVVRHTHAHVWVEVWVEGAGWQRFEPKDFVDPPDPQQAVSAPSKPIEKAKLKPAIPNPQARAEAEAGQSAKHPAVNEPSAAPVSELKLGWLASLSSGLETWMLNYNPQRQIELMRKSGLRVVDWKSLLGISLLGVLLASILYGVLLGYQRRRKDPVAMLFNRLNRALAKKDLACGSHECPSRWLERIKQIAPDIHPALSQVVSIYMQVRYQSLSEAERAVQEKVLKQQVRRLVGMF